MYVCHSLELITERMCLDKFSFLAHYFFPFSLVPLTTAFDTLLGQNYFCGHYFPADKPGQSLCVQL